MSPSHPLHRLFAFARPYRRDAYFASLFSVLNKFFDVLPELLIGVAVDVVVNRRASFLARMGIPDPLHQLFALVALTIAVWVFESLFEYLYFRYGRDDMVWTWTETQWGRGFGTLRRMSMA